MKDTIKISRNGMTLYGPAKIRKDEYIRVRVSIDEAICERPHDAWAMAVDFAFDIYSAVATEDNTIGQITQVDGSDGSQAKLPVKGRVFSLGLNLYGKGVRAIQKRLKELV